MFFSKQLKAKAFLLRNWWWTGIFKRYSASSRCQ